MLMSYGFTDDQLSARLSRRLFTFALLHRYSNIAWYLERVPAPPGVSTLEELAETWYGVAERTGPRARKKESRPGGGKKIAKAGISS